MKEQPEAVALEPCPNPWCNSHKTADAEIRPAEAPLLMPSKASYEWAVACPVCPIQTPWFATEVEAITAWNTRAERRAPLPADVVEMVERAAERLYELDREKWSAEHPDDEFIKWRDCALEPFKDQWRAKAKAALADAIAMLPTDGEPVALAHVSLEDDGLYAELEVLNGETLQPKHSPVPLYTHPAPPLPADVVEMVAKLRSPATVFYEYAADQGALLREAAAMLEAMAGKGWRPIETAIDPELGRLTTELGEGLRR